VEFSWCSITLRWERSTPKRWWWPCRCFTCLWYFLI